MENVATEKLNHQSTPAPKMKKMKKAAKAKSTIEKIANNKGVAKTVIVGSLAMLFLGALWLTRKITRQVDEQMTGDDKILGEVEETSQGAPIEGAALETELADELRAGSRQHSSAHSAVPLNAEALNEGYDDDMADQDLGNVKMPKKARARKSPRVQSGHRQKQMDSTATKH